MGFTFSILYGSVRQTRNGIRAVHFLENELEKRGHAVHVVDPLQRPLPLLDKMYKEYAAGEAPENMESIAQDLLNSDGFIVVSGEYNHALPPALKNLLDHFQREYFFKPAGICTYSAGSFGGVRASVHLRDVLSELGMPTISSVFPIPRISHAFDEDGVPQDEAYLKRADRFITELEWYTEALKNQRAQGTPY